MRLFFKAMYTYEQHNLAHIVKENLKFQKATFLARMELYFPGRDTFFVKNGHVLGREGHALGKNFQHLSKR